VSKLPTLAELKAQLKDIDQRITTLENQSKNDLHPKKNESYDDWMQRLKEETRTPPLITEENLDEALDTLKDVLEEQKTLPLSLKECVQTWKKSGRDPIKFADALTEALI